MNKVIATLATAALATTVALPANAGFVLPDEETSSEYNISTLEWRGCRIPKLSSDGKDFYNILSDINVECLRHMDGKPSNAHIRWKNAKKCDDYTDGCIELEGIIYANGKRHIIGDVKKLNRIGGTGLFNYTVSSYALLSAWETDDVEYEPYKFNCRTSISEVQFEYYPGSDLAHLYYTKKFHHDVCNSVFPPKKDAAYRMKELACNLARDPKQKERICGNFELWNNLRRWQ